MNPVGWFEIYVNDLTRATKFYEDVLQKELSKMDAPVADLEMVSFPMEPDAHGSPGALVKMQGVTAGGYSTVVYFMSDDCAKEESRVVAAGGKVMKSKFSIGEYGFIMLAFDTEGNLFGVHSVK